MPIPHVPNLSKRPRAELVSRLSRNTQHQRASPRQKPPFRVRRDLPRKLRADPVAKRLHLRGVARMGRSEEHTSELQSLMRNSYAVFCLKKKKSYLTTAHPTSIM